MAVAQLSEPNTVERDEGKIARGREILRRERADDPGSGNLGLTINMDGETYNIAQKNAPQNGL